MSRCYRTSAFWFLKQKTAYEITYGDWSSDVCSSDLRLLQMADRQMSVIEAFRLADDVLRHGVQGISDLVTMTGLINLDFADVKAVMQNAGTALMAVGEGRGERRAVLAARAAISSPLLDVSIEGAHGVLLNVSGGPDLTL